MTWLSPSPLSVPNHPGPLLINHLWKQYITARCMFSPKSFQQDPGKPRDTFRNQLLWGQWTLGLSGTSATDNRNGKPCFQAQGEQTSPAGWSVSLCVKLWWEAGSGAT